MSFLSWGLQGWMQHSGWGLMRAEQRGRFPFHNLLVILLLVQLKTQLVLSSIPATPLHLQHLPLVLPPLPVFLLCRKSAAQMDPWTQVGQAGFAQALDRLAGGWRLMKDKEGGYLPAALEVPPSPCLKGLTVSCFLLWLCSFSGIAIMSGAKGITHHYLHEHWQMGAAEEAAAGCGWICMWPYHYPCTTKPYGYCCNGAMRTMLFYFIVPRKATTNTGVGM